MGKRDAKSAGRSTRVPGSRYEPWRSRHSRRLRDALANFQKVWHWCRQRGLSLKVTNRGHHWQFLVEGRQVAEWWPSSAKFVAAKQWDKGVHVHDWAQAIEQLDQLLERSESWESRSSSASSPK